MSTPREAAGHDPVGTYPAATADGHPADHNPAGPDPAKQSQTNRDPAGDDPIEGGTTKDDRAAGRTGKRGAANRDPAQGDPIKGGTTKDDRTKDHTGKRGAAKPDQAKGHSGERGPAEGVSGKPGLAKRDPEGRRRALAAAAVEVIAEVGIGRTTHRAVAARAGVPLGATTYYFPTLADLVEAGLRQVTEATRAELAGWAAELTRENLAPTLARLAAGYLADRPRALLEYELCVAAARDERLRPLLLAWLDGLDALITPFTDAATARAVAMLLDGAMLHAVATGRDLDEPALRNAIMHLTH